MKIDPRHLRYLQAIEENGTFISAAEAEGISQPALTNKISLLEAQLGTRLIDRGRFGARLNDFGRLLLRHARAIDAVIDRATDEVERARQGESGPIVIGATPISMIELVPRALDGLDQHNSRIRVSIEEAYDDLLLDKLRAGEIDLMVGGLLVGQREPDLEVEPLISLPLVAVVGARSKLWQRETIALSELLECDWALPALGSVIRSYVDAIFVASGEAMPNRYWSCSSMHGLKSVIQHTERISLMPRHAFVLEERAGHLKGIRLVGPTSSRQLNILRLRHLPSSALSNLFSEQLRLSAKRLESNSPSV